MAMLASELVLIIRWGREVFPEDARMPTWIARVWYGLFALFVFGGVVAWRRGRSRRAAAELSEKKHA